MTKLYLRYVFVCFVSAAVIIAHFMDLFPAHQVAPHDLQGQQLRELDKRMLGISEHRQVDRSLNEQLSKDYTESVFVNKFRKADDQVIEANQSEAAESAPCRMTQQLNMTLISERNTTRHHHQWPETTMVLKDCRRQDWSDRGRLPTVSVILCFHDGEQLSHLLLTIHSIVQRSPSALLKEIILVDDHSRKEDLQQTLDLYARSVFRGLVRIHRSRRKLGLIRARLQGIQMSHGEAVVVMDSHVEVQPGWLEPLLYEIRRNRKTMASSFLDWIEPKGWDWEYRHAGTFWRAYFDWSFVFGWQSLSGEQIREKLAGTWQDRIAPIRTPVIIGTIFAMERDFFEEVGAFDPGMELWGGENIDLPLRVWLFGGRVVNVPCSRVGHMEITGGRDYRLRSQHIINNNYKRVVDVWFDDYKNYFYMYFPSVSREKILPGLEERRQLREPHTKDFAWFHTNVFPELGLPDRDGFAFGLLHNMATSSCLDFSAHYWGGMRRCNSNTPDVQIMYWSRLLEFRMPLFVLNPKPNPTEGNKVSVYRDEYLSFYNTTRAGKWMHWKNGPMYHIPSKQCLEAVGASHATMRPCDVQGKQSQRWAFDTYTEEYRNMTTGGAYAREKQLFDEVVRSLGASTDLTLLVRGEGGAASPSYTRDWRTSPPERNIARDVL